MIVVTRLITYPLKGARGIPAAVMPLDGFGPADDRRWMAVDPDGSLVTQREASRLCLVEAVPEPGGLRLSAPGQPPLAVARPAGGPAVTVRVWNDQCAAADAGDGAARWLSAALGRPVRLVWMPDGADRRTDPDYDPLGARVSFADGYPALLAGEASLAALNARLAVPLPMERFRPNVVVTGEAAFGEDTWRRFHIGAVPFDAVKPCARCAVTTIDQDTAERGPEPLRTLATFRRGPSGVLFGMNVVHRGGGVLRVGDPVTVETRGRPAVAPG